MATGEAAAAEGEKAKDEMEEWVAETQFQATLEDVAEANRNRENNQASGELNEKGGRPRNFKSGDRKPSDDSQETLIVNSVAREEGTRQKLDGQKGTKLLLSPNPGGDGSEKARESARRSRHGIATPKKEKERTGQSEGDPLTLHKTGHTQEYAESGEKVNMDLSDGGEDSRGRDSDAQIMVEASL